jgi:hypothetical protein
MTDPAVTQFTERIRAPVTEFLRSKQQSRMDLGALGISLAPSFKRGSAIAPSRGAIG